LLDYDENWLNGKHSEQLPFNGVTHVPPIIIMLVISASFNGEEALLVELMATSACHGTPYFP